MEWLVAYLDPQASSRSDRHRRAGLPASELKSRLDRFLHNFNFRRIVPHLNVSWDATIGPF
jgi:hypothetical protein